MPGLFPIVSKDAENAFFRTTILNTLAVVCWSFEGDSIGT